MRTTGWLRCEIADGMFSDEKMVKVRRKGEGRAVFLFPEPLSREPGPKAESVSS